MARAESAGSEADAASSNVRVSPEAVLPPPAAAIRTTPCPLGPVSRTSTSCGYAWAKPFREAVTFVTTPVMPDTVTDEGYGAPFPPTGMTIVVVLPLVCPRSVLVPSGKLKGTSPIGVPLSVSCSDAETVPPHVPVAVKVKLFVTAAPPGARTP